MNAHFGGLIRTKRRTWTCNIRPSVLYCPLALPTGTADPAWSAVIISVVMWPHEEGGGLNEL